MSSRGVDGDPKPPCLPRNGLVKLPGQPNGLGTASITKGTPAAKNRPCQPPPPPTLPPPSLAAPLSRVALAGGPCPPASGPTSGPVPGPPAERPPLATDEKILNGLFWYFSACEKCVLAQVCKAWRRVLYQPKFWAGLTPVLHAKELYNVLPGGEKEFVNLQGFAARGFEGFCLVGVSDLDICEFIDNYALSKKGVKAMSLKRSTITDAGLELLPNLAELSLQAYHVTDTALAYFTARQGHSTHTLRLLSCWEITNHGVVNVVHSLPNLTSLSLSGCSKVTDDGVELVAENLRKLRSLDLSWCPRITDMALEYVACDLHRLEELVLDRCVRITDTGLSYLSTMSSLRSLYLRWCCQVQDFGLKHLLAMRSLRLLSLAGCPLLTTTGLSGLVQLQELEELELTNCPGATPELFKYFSQHLPRCLVIE
uniref:F-box/LRR-repeat protein 16 isoform X2 n=1 Tax=Jaculus jaculus TaxID=51337 RepID=UPI001E1B337D|nr:F-box/LRR-repeat protein 16 isoform X2 [Jaculus jaculus]